MTSVMKRWLLIPVLVFIGLCVYLSVTQNDYPKTRAVTSQQTAHTAQPTPQPATKESLLAAVNAERAKYNAPALTEDARLDASAQAKACDERDNHYFGHVSPSGVHGYQLAERSAELHGYYSENLTEPTPVTTDQTMKNWITSKPHLDAMIDVRYTLTGFGICGNDVAEHFYRPL